MSLRDELLRRFPALRKLPAGCYVVGGAVRDLLLGRDPLDVDIAAVGAAQVASLVRSRVITLGRDPSAYRVIAGDRVYDFADIQGVDIDEDLGRRDYTMNALAIDLATGAMLDRFGGERDARDGIVRMVHAKNFDDDPLRIVKGVRMAVKYGFTIEPRTLDAIRTRAAMISAVAAERVSAELAMIFSSNAFSRATALLHETGLFDTLGFVDSDCSADDVSLAGAYALLVRDPREYAERWKWSDALLRDVIALQRLMQSHDRMTLFDAGERVARQLPPLIANAPLDWPDFSIRPLLTGDEIAAVTGLPPGKELGARKRALLEAQVRGEVRTREEAEHFVRQ